MTKAEVEVITSERRRRHWSRAEKERIVAAALEPGATILGVAREFGVPLIQDYPVYDFKTVSRLNVRF